MERTKDGRTVPIEQGLVLVTGAGASREVGLDQPLPLMTEWSTALCESLDSIEKGLARACGLEPDMRSEDFEEALGLLIRWQDVRKLAPRFFGLGGSPRPGEVNNHVTRAHEVEERRLAAVSRGMAESLHEEFGTRRIDELKATGLYRSLLQVMSDRFPWVVFATTNYDPSIEIALNALGSPSPETGFDRLPARDPVLRPHGLVKRCLTGSTLRVPVLHLHGSVGWYEKDGEVNEIGPDKDFNETLGAPAVLFPDPDKDPTQSAAVRDLWREFDSALAVASHVLVIGHSLNDGVLVERLRATEARVGVTCYGGDPNLEAHKHRIAELLPSAVFTELDFREPVELDPIFMQAWCPPSRSGK